MQHFDLLIKLLHTNNFFALYANVHAMISDETINVKLSNDDEILNYCKKKMLTILFPFWSLADITQRFIATVTEKYATYEFSRCLLDLV